MNRKNSVQYEASSASAREPIAFATVCPCGRRRGKIVARADQKPGRCCAGGLRGNNEGSGGRGQRRQPLFKIPGAASGGSETKSKDGRTEGKGRPSKATRLHAGRSRHSLRDGRTADGRNDGGVDDGRRVQNRPYIPQKRLSKGRNERMRRVAFVGGRAAAAAASSEWKGIGAQGAQWYCAVSVFLSFRDSDW